MRCIEYGSHILLYALVLQLIDVSTAASAQDFKPNRYTVIVNLLKDFIREFFDQNPLSQLGILLMKNGQAQKLSDLSSSPVRNFSK